MNKIYKNKAKSKRYHLTIAEKQKILAVYDEQYALPGKTTLRSLVHTVGIKCGLVVTYQTINANYQLLIHLIIHLTI